jgi:transcription termination factor NusB
MEDTCYSTIPRTQEELKENIRKEIANIAVEQLQTVNQNIFRRCKEYLLVEGHDFQRHL